MGLGGLASTVLQARRRSGDSPAKLLQNLRQKAALWDQGFLSHLLPDRTRQLGKSDIIDSYQQNQAMEQTTNTRPYTPAKQRQLIDEIWFCPIFISSLVAA